MAFTRGPQLHFWISDTVVSKTEQQETVVEKGKTSHSPECYCQEESKKEHGLPPYYHVEIF